MLENIEMLLAIVLLAPIEIELTIWAWRSEWRTRALLPIGLLFIVLMLLVVFRIVDSKNLWIITFFHMVIIATLVYMIVRPHDVFSPSGWGHRAFPMMSSVAESFNQPAVPEFSRNAPVSRAAVASVSAAQPANMSPVFPLSPERQKSPLAPVAPIIPVAPVADLTPVAQAVPVTPLPRIIPLPPQSIYQSNPVVSRPVTQLGSSESKIPKPTLTFHDNNEITFTDPIKLFGRNDFSESISPDALRFVSRNHFLIKSESGKYFIEDLNSTNGSKVNGVEIRGNRYELNNGDRIEIANSISLMFTV